MQEIKESFNYEKSKKPIKSDVAIHPEEQIDIIVSLKISIKRRKVSVMKKAKKIARIAYASTVISMCVKISLQPSRALWKSYYRFLRVETLRVRCIM